jgi:FlaA1/EpsC-like NDP-sugar epimerase
MRRSFPDVPFHPVIGSIQDAQDLDTVFARFEPAIVYHAAAYKHVPIMEHHAFQAIENNVFGTLKLALAAERAAVQDFVMISSDKAVRPTSIMGATKRLAELVIRSRGHGPVKYVAVRFGNVLGSNGSVIPVFKDQIAHGGPVTVTHPDMRRYFMTIPEACQLVLQASTMGKGGEIFVLDMGEPVRIVDLARNLILLSGLRPDEDIKIEFSGIRPGEKLYEELSTLDEGTLPTSHDKINVFAGAALPWCIMENQLESLTEACSARNLKKLVLLLKDLVPEYNPSGDLLREVFGTEEASDSEQLFVTARWEPDSLQLLSS